MRPRAHAAVRPGEHPGRLRHLRVLPLRRPPGHDHGTAAGSGRAPSSSSSSWPRWCSSDIDWARSGCGPLASEPVPPGPARRAGPPPRAPGAVGHRRPDAHRLDDGGPDLGSVLAAGHRDLRAGARRPHDLWHQHRGGVCGDRLRVLRRRAPVAQPAAALLSRRRRDRGPWCPAAAGTRAAARDLAAAQRDPGRRARRARVEPGARGPGGGPGGGRRDRRQHAGERRVPRGGRPSWCRSSSRSSSLAAWPSRWGGWPRR